MSKKTKVLQVIGGSEFGGAVWIILSYIKLLQKHEFEVTVVCSSSSVGDVYRKAGCAIVPIREMKRNIRPLYDLRSLYKLTRLCRNGHYDIVHTHTSKGGFLGRAAARLARVPIIIHTSHGFAVHESSSALAIKLFGTLERIAALWCDKIIFVSNSHRDWALRLHIAHPEKMVTVRNGIAPERLKNAGDRFHIRHQLGIDPDAVLIGAFGRLAPQKGLECLLEAMGIVIRHHPQTQLVIVGEGALSQELKDYADRLCIRRSTFFTGFKQNIGDIIAACNIVVSPSMREGLSVTLLEAMAMAKPIIATTIASNREIIRDGVSGLLVPPKEPKALAAAIISLIVDPPIGAKMGLVANQLFAESFTENAMQNRLWEVYDALIRKKLLCSIDKR